MVKGAVFSAIYSVLMSSLGSLVPVASLVRGHCDCFSVNATGCPERPDPAHCITFLTINLCIFVSSVFVVLSISLRSRRLCVPWFVVTPLGCLACLTLLIVHGVVNEFSDSLVCKLVLWLLFTLGVIPCYHCIGEFYKTLPNDFGMMNQQPIFSVPSPSQSPVLCTQPPPYKKDPPAYSQWTEESEANSPTSQQPYSDPPPTYQQPIVLNAASFNA